MTQRSMQAGSNQTIIIKVGTSVVVKGHDSDMLVAETKGKWGLQIERHSASQFARARAAVGETVLFDIKLNKPGSRPDEKGSDEVIEVKMGTSGEVFVPFSSNLKIYAGKDIEVQSVRGQVDAYSGRNLSMKDVTRLGNASAGRSMMIDCQSMLGQRCHLYCWPRPALSRGRPDQRPPARQGYRRLLGSPHRRRREIGLPEIGW